MHIRFAMTACVCPSVYINLCTSEYFSWNSTFRRFTKIYWHLNIYFTIRHK